MSGPTSTFPGLGVTGTPMETVAFTSTVTSIKFVRAGDSTLQTLPSSFTETFACLVVTA